MFSKLISFLSKFSFKNMFSPFAKSVLRFMFSDRKTGQILRVIGFFLGSFRFITFMLGLCVFISLYDFQNLFSIEGISSIIYTFYKIWMDNFKSALDKIWPNHPGTPKLIEDIQNSDVVHKITDKISENPLAKKVSEVAHQTEDKFFSLRKWYNKLKPSWFSNNDSPVDTTSIFHSWLFW